jgi:hypothetical protein
VSASRDALPILLLACACGASLRSPPPDPRDRRVASTAPAPKTPLSTADSRDGAEPDPRAVALRDRGATIAPGMRLAAERRSRDAEVDLIHADGQDQCVRVAFDANEPISAQLTNARGEVLARTAEPAGSGVLPAGGPVCVRSGDAISAVAIRAPDAGPGTAVRWAAWAAP